MLEALTRIAQSPGTLIGSHMENALGIGLGVVGVAVCVLWFVWRANSHLRYMKRVPRTPIADLKAGGVVKIVGRVRLQRRLTSPLTGAQCACFSLEITSVGGENHTVLVADSEAVPFDVEDATGTIEVDPVLFRIVPGSNTTAVRRLPQVEPGSIFLDYLEFRADRASSGHQSALACMRQSSPLIVCEHAIRDGETVAVLGEVSLLRDSGDSRSLVLTSPDTADVVVSTEASTFA